MCQCFITDIKIMKIMFRDALLVLAIVGIIIVIWVCVQMWTICMPLAIAMICDEAGGIFKDVVRKLTGEKESRKQLLAGNIANLPVVALCIYLLWPSHMILAIAYGIVILGVIFVRFLETVDEKLLFD